MKRIETLLLINLLLMLFSCGSPVSDGGSVSDIGNPCISGIVFNAQGDRVPNTEVVLLHCDYNPISDSPIIDTLKDTTNSEGEFSINQEDTIQKFNLEATVLSSGNLALQNNIYASSDTNCNYNITVKPTGNILVQLEDTTNLTNGHLYIPGSRISQNIKESGVTFEKDRYFTSFTSLPQGAISKLHTLSRDEITTAISDSFTVSNDETVAIRSNTFWKSHNSLTSNLPDDSITTLLPGIGSTLFAGTAQSGLYKYQNNEWSHISGSPATKITALCKANDETVWIGTTEGVYLYKNNLVSTIDTLLLPSKSITALQIDSLQNLWIGTTEGALMVTGSEQIIFDSSNTDFSENYVVDIQICEDSTVYLCTPFSFGTYKNYNWTVSNNGEEGLQLTTPISSLGVNRIGKIYLTTATEILVKSQSFWYSFDQHTEGMKNCNISTIVIDNNSKAWAATNDTTYIYKLNTPHVYDYNRLNTPRLSNVGSILCTAVDEENNIFYGTSEGGILEMWEEK